MITIDEENYKEAMEASFKVFSPRGIGAYFSNCDILETHDVFPSRFMLFLVTSFSLLSLWDEILMIQTPFLADSGFFSLTLRAH